MLPTHALFGMLLALPVAVLAPEYAPVAFGAGLAGGILPDLDLYVGHRKTLHYPVGYSLLAGVAGVAAVVSPTAATVGAPSSAVDSGAGVDISRPSPWVAHS